jgi:hypothetical protein
MPNVRYFLKYAAAYNDGRQIVPPLEDMLVIARANGEAARKAAEPVKQVTVYQGEKVVAVVAKQPPAPPEPGEEFGRTFAAIMRGQPAYAPPVPVGETFEQATTRLLHAPGAPLPQPWRAVEKASTEVPANLARYQSGRFG